MKLPQLCHLAAVPLAFTLLSFNASAVSPPHPTGLDAPMISVSSMNANNYAPVETVKMFPAPKKGMVQHILTLPKLENETDYMVEIQIGQTQLVDCNKHGLVILPFLTEVKSRVHATINGGFPPLALCGRS